MSHFGYGNSGKDLGSSSGRSTTSSILRNNEKNIKNRYSYISCTHLKIRLLFVIGFFVEGICNKKNQVNSQKLNKMHLINLLEKKNSCNVRVLVYAGPFKQVIHQNASHLHSYDAHTNKIISCSSPMIRGVTNR